MEDLVERLRAKPKNPTWDMPLGNGTTYPVPALGATWPEDKLREEAANEIEAIMEALHYPECWDTVNYPTLLDAVKETGCNPDCCTKTK